MSGLLADSGLTEERVAEFLAARREAGCSQHYGRRAMMPMMDFLAGQHVTPATSAVGPAASGAESVLAGFEAYLVSERALSPATVTAYLARGRRFLANYTADGAVGALTCADVTRAIAAEAERVSVGGVRTTSRRSCLAAVLPCPGPGRYRSVGGGAGCDGSADVASAPRARRPGHAGTAAGV